MKINTIQAMQDQRSSGVCILLYLFLGYFGAHRFYAYGLTAFNVIYAFTCGFFGIMLIADLFLVWGMADKGNRQRMANAQVMDELLKS
ncbi:hypothetical protein VPHD528_0097 [Vibrio phage D528]